MSKRQKTIERFRQNPRNVRFNEIHNLLIGLGFEQRSRGGSHFVYTKKGAPPITLVHRKPFLLPAYVKEVLRIIDEYLSDEED